MKEQRRIHSIRFKDSEWEFIQAAGKKIDMDPAKLIRQAALDRSQALLMRDAVMSVKQEEPSKPPMQWGTPWEERPEFKQAQRKENRRQSSILNLLKGVKRGQTRRDV